MDDSYDPIADYYDLWCESDPSSEQCVSFYLRNAPLHGDPIIEVGVGTGRIALGLAELGLQVIGVDSSEKMLEQCARKIKLSGHCPNLKLVCKDFLDFQPVDAVGQVIMPYRAIGHFKSYLERLQLFKHVRSIIKPGGFLLFDHFVFYNVSSLEAVLAQERVVLDRQTAAGTITMKNSLTFDHPNQLISSKLIVEKIDNQSSLSTVTYSHKIAWISPLEIESLAKLVGFKITNCFGAFDETPLSNRSSEQVWLMQVL
jgi:ubiquinone/menaquinone biosynthesis C-methylase UbiE